MRTAGQEDGALGTTMPARLLLELGLSADLDELDRRVAADPAFLQEHRAHAHQRQLSLHLIGE